MFENFATSVIEFAAKIPFDTVVWIVWGSFFGFYLLTFILNLALPAINASSKKPFLGLVCAYTALTFAAFLTVNEINSAAFVAAIFFIVGYLFYGLLCAVKRRDRNIVTRERAVCAAPAIAPTYKKSVSPANSAAANSSVRLEYAQSITKKLLEKNPSRTDRQELEKLKTTLDILCSRGELSSAEGEILNENFNALLKLMAKYNA